MQTPNQQTQAEISKLLQPGDLLIFSRKSFFNWLIKLKTFSQATHTEVYTGNGKTIASRNGEGAAQYDLDLEGIYQVLRPVQALNLDNAMHDFWLCWNAKPYGWLALLSFILVDVKDNGIFCSELSTLFFRACGLDPFNEMIREDVVAPADFMYISRKIMALVYSRDQEVK